MNAYWWISRREVAARRGGLPLLLIVACAAILAACGSISAAPENTRSPLEERGRAVFKAYCSRCHSNSGETIVVGPSLAGVGSRADGRIAGMDAAKYLRESILNPGAYVVEGFADGVMPADISAEMSDQELESVVAYLLTLK